MSVTPDMAAVLAVVGEQLGEQLDVLDRIGGAYALRVATAAGRPATITGPQKPRDMHPAVAKMIRELVGDELAARHHLARLGSPR